MNCSLHPRKALLAAAVLLVPLTTLLADPPAPQTITDRAGFLPRQKHQALKGKAIGVLVYDAQPVLSTEGRSGPADQLCFGCNGASYRWVYVPVVGNAQISNLKVPVGDKPNAQWQVYPSLDIARPKNVTPWGVTAPYSLVEVEVNNGLGSPVNDSFVATKIKVLDGTKEYPLRTTEVLKQLKDRYAAYKKEQAKAIEAALSEAQQKALKERKPTGPREQEDLMFVTWLPDQERLRVRFRTKVSDGAYSFVGGGVGPVDRPNPLPPGKVKGIQPPPPPPPPREFKVKVGTTYGVEFGVAYEVGKDGTLVGTAVLPFASFQQELQPPPRIGPRDPFPLPPPPKQ
jgi:hypothetical protein